MERRSLLLLLTLAILLVLCAPAAKADTISYVWQGTASGSIGGNSFQNSEFTITLTADSNSISQFTLGCSPTACSIYDVAASTATITVDGVTSDITSAIGVFDNQTMSVFGLGRITGPGPAGIGGDLLDMSDPAFASYNLTGAISAVGPISMGTLSEFSCSAGCVITGVGNLTMSSATGVTFSDPVNTPEPSSLLLLASGGLALVCLRRKALANSRA